MSEISDAELQEVLRDAVLAGVLAERKRWVDRNNEATKRMKMNEEYADVIRLRDRRRYRNRRQDATKREHENAVNRAGYAKRAVDPAYLERQAQYQREHRQRLRESDPEGYEKFKERDRNYQKNARLKKEAAKNEQN